MESCLLCLELKQEFVGIFYVNSNQWHELKIRDILNKHLWSMDHITNKSWICSTCWTELYEFHKFYIRIEGAHRELGLLKTNVKEAVENFDSKVEGVEESFDNKVDDTVNDKTDILLNKLEEMPFEVLVESAGPENKDFLNENDAVNITKEEHNTLPKIEESIENESVKKRKRGRPRKSYSENISNKTKIQKTQKVENIPNEGVKSRNSSNKSKKQKQLKSREKTLKEIETENNTNVMIKSETKPHTTLPLSDEYHAPFDKYGGSDNESEREASVHAKIKSDDIGPPKLLRNEKDKFIADNFKMKCFLCDMSLDTFYNMRKHFELQHTEPGHIQCCNRKFFRRSLFVDHVHYHLNPNYFKCSKCDKVMEDRRRLELHLKTHDVNSGKNHFCDVCGKGFLIVGVLNKHKMIHLSEEEKRFECSDCGKKFATNYMLITHHRINHLKKYVKICDTCGKAIRDKDVFKRHMLRHEGKTATVSCDVCGLLLTDNKALKRHKEVIHPAGGQKEYTCSICSKKSPNFRAHKLHVQFKHETGYNYKCTICDKAFKKAPSLKEHMASHTGTVLYTCPWCPKTFNSNANMHHHRKRVHPKEWEETSRKRYSGKLPPYFKPPISTETLDK